MTQSVQLLDSGLGFSLGPLDAVGDFVGSAASAVKQAVGTATDLVCPIAQNPLAQAGAAAAGQAGTAAAVAGVCKVLAPAPKTPTTKPTVTSGTTSKSVLRPLLTIAAPAATSAKITAYKGGVWHVAVKTGLSGLGDPFGVAPYTETGTQTTKPTDAQGVTVPAYDAAVGKPWYKKAWPYAVGGGVVVLAAGAWWMTRGRRSGRRRRRR